MAVTNIPNVQNWTVTPQNGQSGYFDLMNTWLGQSTLVIASLQSAITAQNAANSEINTLASQVSQDTNTTVTAKDEAVTALALLEELQDDIKNFKLDKWNPKLASKVYTLVLNSFSNTDIPQEKLEILYKKLCKIDINSAFEIQIN